MLSLQREEYRLLVDPLLALEIAAPEIGVAEVGADVLYVAHRLARRGQRLVGAAELGIGAGEAAIEVGQGAHPTELDRERDALLVEIRRPRPVLSRHGKVGLTAQDIDLDLVEPGGARVLQAALEGRLRLVGMPERELGPSDAVERHGVPAADLGPHALGGPSGSHAGRRRPWRDC